MKEGSTGVLTFSSMLRCGHYTCTTVCERKHCPKITRSNSLLVSSAQDSLIDSMYSCEKSVQHCFPPPPFLHPHPASMKSDAAFSFWMSLGRVSRGISSWAYAVCIASLTLSSVSTKLSMSSSLSNLGASSPFNSGRLPLSDSGLSGVSIV